VVAEQQVQQALTQVLQEPQTQAVEVAQTHQVLRRQQMVVQVVQALSL
jgi:hypothetical protein